jgi:hypothetical protein
MAKFLIFWISIGYLCHLIERSPPWRGKRAGKTGFGRINGIRSKQKQTGYQQMSNGLWEKSISAQAGDKGRKKRWGNNREIHAVQLFTLRVLLFRK